MNTLRRIGSFYRLQFHILWTWRAGRVALVKRGIVSFLIAFAGLWFVAWLLPGVNAPGLGTIVAATIALTALNLLIRPALLGLLGGISLVLMIVATLVFQVAAFLLVSRFVPEYQVASWLTALVASFVYAAVDTILGAIFAVDEGDSYWGALIQQLASRNPDVIRTDKPGVLIVQIDGLANPILQHQIRAGRVPFLSQWVRSGAVRLDEWEALLPSQTSASQAGILHGNNSFIPAFRWWEKDRGVMMVSNHPPDAKEIVRRASDGHGLLSNNGASIGNLVSGDAARSYITMATIKDRTTGLPKSQAFYAFFVSPTNYLHAVIRGVGDMLKEYIQAARERRAGVEPRMHRGMPYPIARAATNVLLRSLSTSLVIEEMYRGAPVIYVDYTDYDEIAHHSGPERAEALDALDGVDRTLRALHKAAEATPRPYKIIVLSDHGQSLGATFLQRYGETLQSVIGKLMGGPDSVRAATERVEEWGPLNAFLTEASAAGGATGVMTRAAFRGKMQDGAVELGPAGAGSASRDTSGGKGGKGGNKAEPVTAAEPPELVVGASGNLGLVSFARLPGRVSLETMQQTWPGMVEALAGHPGIGFLLVRSEAHGAIAVGRKGIRYLDEDRVEGEDPTAVFSGHPILGLQRVDGMEHCPDIAVISLLDPMTDEVAAFEELIGSHGGLGGPQTHPFILHPAEWEITEPIIGAEAVYRQIRTWLSSVGIELGPGAAAASAAPAPAPAAKDAA